MDRVTDPKEMAIYGEVNNYVNSIYYGFLGHQYGDEPGVEPISLPSAAGNGALGALLLLAKFIVKDECKRKLGDLFIENNGERVHLNMYEFTKNSCSKYMSGEVSWPPSKHKGKGVPYIGDVIAKYCISPDTAAYLKFKFTLIGVVKSSANVDNDALFRQAWKQALVGLTNSNETHGLLLHPRGAKLFQLKTHVLQEQQPDMVAQKLSTRTKVFPFRTDVNDDSPHEPVRFQVDQLLYLLKSIIAIFKELEQEE